MGDVLHNVVTLIMHENHIGLHEALERAAAMHAERTRHALEDLYPSICALRFSPEVDAMVKLYADGLMNWSRANYEWHFESQRYFGTNGARVQRERTVALFPRRDAANPLT